MFPWNRIREDLIAGFERARKGVLSTPQVIFQEADNLKLTISLQKIDERIHLLYIEVGRQAYEKYRAHGPSGFKKSEAVGLFEKIELAISERSKITAELEKLHRRKSEEQGE
jgi:hypothetical protein